MDGPLNIHDLMSNQSGPLLTDTIDEYYHQISEFRQKIIKAEEMDIYTHRMIQNTYRTGLIYLLGGIESATTVVNLQGKQLKVLYLGQLISFVEGILKFYTEAEASPEDIDQDMIDDFDDDNRDTYATIKQDLDALPQDFGATHRGYLLDRASEYEHLAKSIHNEYAEKSPGGGSILTLSRTIGRWRNDLDSTQLELENLIAAFGLEENVLARMQHEPETLEQMLNDTVNEKLSSKTGGDAQRANSPLIRLLRMAADRYKRNIENNLKKVTNYRRKLKKAILALENEAAVKYAPQIPGATSLKANHFAPDVIITASPVSRRGRDTNMAKVIVISAQLDTATTFVLKDKLIQRQV
jgi:hypothetical protein